MDIDPGEKEKGSEVLENFLFREMVLIDTQIGFVNQMHIFASHAARQPVNQLVNCKRIEGTMKEWMQNRVNRHWKRTMMRVVLLARRGAKKFTSRRISSFC